MSPDLDRPVPRTDVLHPILAMKARHFRHDSRRVATPHVEAQVVVRFGPSLPGGVDVHAMGARQQGREAQDED